MKRTCFIFALCGVFAALARGESVPTATLTVQTDRPGAKINAAMWGVFFEDINLGADGGLYAELVKNRAFEFPEPLMGWTKSIATGAQGTISVQDAAPFNRANPHYLRLESQGTADFGIANEGFRGIGLKAGEIYDFSAQVRIGAGTPGLRVELVGADNKVIATGKISGGTTQWQKLTTKLTATATEAKARLRVLVEGKAAVDLDMVSLFPEKTWLNRPGGLRADLVQLLADMKPGFVRFPGGCIVEGNYLTNRYQWKTTIGPVAERKLIVNRWNFEFKHRPTPDYYQSFGLGFFEYFQLCADIGAEPLPILNCGMACQFNSGQLCPPEELDQYIQDALDLIEFANGPVSTTWGGKRAAMGHPAPFNLKMLGVGNEQWGAQYFERLAKFQSALKAKHPEIALVASAGPSPADDRFDFAWPKLRALATDIVDEHCYANPSWFFTSVNRFDSYDRSGPKVFFGEYAAQSDKIVSVENRNNWECALSEAAFMTGLERNADVVRMASYAPLFAHVDGWQWTPNLIWTDNLRSYGTPNYQVQSLFSQNRGDTVLPAQLSLAEAAVAPRGGLTVGTFKSAAEFKDIVITSGNETIFRSNFSDASGWSLPRDGQWKTQDGALVQADAGATSAASFSGAPWTAYSISLKARKLAGAEGFLISFRNELPNTRVQWNLGGWGNTRHGLQSWLGVQEQLVAQTPGHVEEGRWYEVRIELKGAQVHCYLDGQLVHSATVPLPRSGGVFASAVRDDKAGEVILKLVNATAAARDLAVKLAGVKFVKPGSRGTVLSSSQLADENDLQTPNRIAPRSLSVQIHKPEFIQTLPANSFTVLRLPVE